MGVGQEQTSRKFTRLPYMMVGVDGLQRMTGNAKLRRQFGIGKKINDELGPQKNRQTAKKKQDATRLPAVSRLRTPGAPPLRRAGARPKTTQGEPILLAPREPGDLSIFLPVAASGADFG